MKNVTKQDIDTLIDREEIPLLATHTKLCVPIINRLYKKMIAGLKVPSIKVCDNMICDGHHSYIASLLAKVEIHTVQSLKTSATTITQWEAVVFEDNDWDKPEDVVKYNQQDASYHQIEVHKLLEMLK